ncbi:Tonsoku-like protein NF-kappa-B inhibitor-like protein 2 [Triplophysa tibetana]|uniref:Tonsoku-like protein n=1 Tax=Triplophysa tibetana TaxID=1572043 RepID=A0A5A9NN43_9TELE|nr:Tonsoku-like protein NF-kappa-B inhibitor-like protein 2 [Triplophysa tibetana]
MQRFSPFQTHQKCFLDLNQSDRQSGERKRMALLLGGRLSNLYHTEKSSFKLQQHDIASKHELSGSQDREAVICLGNNEVKSRKANLSPVMGRLCPSLLYQKRCGTTINQSTYVLKEIGLLLDRDSATSLLNKHVFGGGLHPQILHCLHRESSCQEKPLDKFFSSKLTVCAAEQERSDMADNLPASRSTNEVSCLAFQKAKHKCERRRAAKPAHRKSTIEIVYETVQLFGEHISYELNSKIGECYAELGNIEDALKHQRLHLNLARSINTHSRAMRYIASSCEITNNDALLHCIKIQTFKSLIELSKGWPWGCPSSWTQVRKCHLRQGNPKEECETWLNIAVYTAALSCAERSGRRVLRAWLQAQQRCGSSQCDDTEARLQELCERDDGRRTECNKFVDRCYGCLSLNVCVDEDLEGYDKMVTGKRKTQRWTRRNEKGESVLHRACIEGNFKQVQYLLDQGHPVNVRDYCGWTPLHEACNYGHEEVVGLLLERGANINDPGGRACEGVTPLHDTLNCGHFSVARILIQRGASVTVRNGKGHTPLDTLRQWFKTYSRELDHETKQECLETEKLLKKALSGDVSVVSAAPLQRGELQDSQLFDAECSEPLLQEDVPPSSQRAAPRPVTSPAHKNSAPRHRGSTGPARRARGMEADVLNGNESNLSDFSDSDCSVSPLRHVWSTSRFPASQSPQRVPPSQEVPSVYGVRNAASPLAKESSRIQYHKVMQNLGSAKSRLFTQSLSEPASSSTPAVSANSRSALVPEDEYVADDWLEDDLGDVQPKKKRRVSEHNVSQESSWRNQNHFSVSAEVHPKVQSSSSRGLSLKKGAGKARQVKMNHLPGMVMLGRREVSRSQSPTMTQDPDPAAPSHQPMPHTSHHVPAPIRMRVRVQDNVFLIPVPHGEGDSCTVAWLCEQAAQRYYQKCGLLPRLSLQKEGALLLPTDPLLAVLHTNEEVFAEVCSWDLPPLPERYRKACQTLTVEENKRVSRLCEVQDNGSCVNVCGLSLPPASLAPLLRALKLQASLTELRLYGNRLNNDLLPELMSAVATMPKLRILDISANQITGEGLCKALDAFEGRSQHAFPCLEELNFSTNPLGDGWAQALATLLSACPLLSTLSLQACGLSARFLQQHRLLLANAMNSTGNLRSVCLSHNALGSTGFELVLKTLPLQCLTHLRLSSVCRGSSDQPAVEILTKLLTQVDCTLTHLSLAGNGLTDNSILSLSRCLPVCPSLVSLDLSANPAVTSAGLRSLLDALVEAQRPLTHLNLQGCQVSGPWGDLNLDSLSDHIRDLRLCSQSLNKLDQNALQHGWRQSTDPVNIFSSTSKCMLSVTGASH